MAAAKSGFLGHKEKRLRRMYGIENPWPALIDDAVELLVAQKLLAEDGGRWATGPNFEVGTKLVVIPEPRQTVTVLSREQRESGRTDALGMDISAAAAKLYLGRTGLRRLHKEHVAELVESMRDCGYLDTRQILFDQHGRLIDGRHRLAAVEEIGLDVLGLEELPVAMVEVESDLQALQLAWFYNKGQESWTKRDVNHLTSLLGGHHPAEVLKMGPQVARAAEVFPLHPGATQRRLAAKAGVSQMTASRSRQKLKEAGHDVGPDARQVKHAQIVKVVAENPDASNRTVAKIAGVSHHTVASARVGNLNQGPDSNCPPDRKVKPEPKKEPDPRGPERTWRVKWRGDWSLMAEQIVRRLKEEPSLARRVYLELDAWRGWDELASAPE